MITPRWSGVFTIGVAGAIALAACDGGSGAKPRVRGAAVGARHGADSTVGPTGAPHARSGGVILFVGTSLTAGLGLDPDEAFPAVVAHRLDSLSEQVSYEVVNAGVSGETSADLRRRIGWLLRRPATVIVIETGANDGLRGLSVDSMRVNIQAILDSVRAEQPAARVILAAMEAPPNMGPRYAASFRRTMPELARRNGVSLLPFLLAGVAGVDTLNQADGMHPNVRGAQIVAANVLRVLRPLLDSVSRRAPAP